MSYFAYNCWQDEKAAIKEQERINREFTERKANNKAIIEGWSEYYCLEIAPNLSAGTLVNDFVYRIIMTILIAYEGVNMNKIMSVLMFCLVLFGCSQGSNILGTWVEPINGQEPNMQGFTLKEDGKAVSFNMATLQYHNWIRQGDKLILQGKSIGNGVEFTFTETYLIKKLTSNTLVLEQNNNELTFKLQK
ncbi:lipocalin-like protein [Orbus hercynius]|uniref:Lipocalin-like protein n=1 Tax=Orbus hercynius TaxID=593135 RepID=A0A495RIW6_9GAMM|nr:lipocalin family protein [Orbus hercynius]RKS87351.1 lipocalin-like protein [Orbus hercynius]